MNLSSWILEVAQNNVFMIILERSTSILFSVYSRSLLKKSDFRWLGKRLYSARLMFNNLTKLTKTLMRWVEINLWRKKEYFTKHFVVCEFFFRIAMFSWLFSWSFRINNNYQFFLILNILLDKVDSHTIYLVIS